MNRLVNSGHLIVAALFAAAAGIDLTYGFVRVLHSRHLLERMLPSAGNSPDIFPIGSILFLACAWGIFKWRTWAHTLAVVLCALSLFVLLLGPHARRTIFGQIANELVVTATLIWLLVPSVRARFAKVV